MARARTGYGDRHKFNGVAHPRTWQVHECVVNSAPIGAVVEAIRGNLRQVIRRTLLHRGIVGCGHRAVCIKHIDIPGENAIGVGANAGNHLREDTQRGAAADGNHIRIEAQRDRDHLRARLYWRKNERANE